MAEARQAAEDALLDRTRFVVTEEAYDAFLARLAAPAEPSQALVRTMTTPAPWDEG